MEYSKHEVWGGMTGKINIALIEKFILLLLCLKSTVIGFLKIKASISFLIFLFCLSFVIIHSFKCIYFNRDLYLYFSYQLLVFGYCY